MNTTPAIATDDAIDGEKADKLEMNDKKTFTDNMNRGKA